LATCVGASAKCSTINAAKSESMITLRVHFDFHLLQSFQEGNVLWLVQAWEQFSATNSLSSLTLPDVFALDHSLCAGARSSVDRNASYAEERKSESIATIARVFPDTEESIQHDLQVVFLPFGKLNVGPREGLQLFSLHPFADPLETYLFLTHVYYHEISFLNYSQASRLYARCQNSPSEFISWIKLLVRNEGIANFAVMDDLVTFRDGHPGYLFKYFKYAHQIDDPHCVVTSMSMLNKVLASVNAQSLENFREHGDLIFKNGTLSIINIAGIHMARCIAQAHGLSALKDIHGKEPEEFFELYLQSGDALWADA
jgi:hypothetical protein